MRVVVKGIGASRSSLGWFGSILFCAVGFLFAYVMARGALHEYRVANDYREATCTVLATRPGHGKNAPAMYIDVSLSIAGHARTVKNVPVQTASRTGRFVAKATAPCFYDPDDPDAVAVERGGSMPIPAQMAMLLFPGVFIFFGLRGLVEALHGFGKSPEAILAQRTMARAHRAHSGDAAHAAPAGPKGSPYRGPRVARAPEDLEGLPLPTVVTLSGSTLPVRLVRGQARVAELGGTGFVAIFWNAIVGIIGAGMLSSKTPGVMLFLLPFACIGAVLGWIVVRRVLLFAVREPILELSAHPLRCGAPVRVAIRQRGPLHATRIVVTLRGVESATRRSGKSTHTDKRTFFEADLADEIDLRLDRSASWQREVDVALPADTPASFGAQWNAIRYEIVVKTTIPHFPDDENAYPVLVLPAPGGDDV
jgi:hypothetical protein